MAGVLGAKLDDGDLLPSLSNFSLPPKQLLPPRVSGFLFAFHFHMFLLGCSLAPTLWVSGEDNREELRRLHVAESSMGYLMTHVLQGVLVCGMWRLWEGGNCPFVSVCWGETSQPTISDGSCFHTRRHRTVGKKVIEQGGALMV